MLFDKMHGLGNDFVIIEKQNNLKLNPEIIREICNRKFGVGCDTLVIYSMNDFLNIEFFNADGSPAETCGNALRCLGLLMQKKYGYKEIKAVAGDKEYSITISDKISVDMGKPVLNAEKIGITNAVDTTGIDFSKIGELVSKFYGINIDAGCVSIGNPHLIVFSEGDIDYLGELFNQREFFINGINVSFAKIKDRHNIELQVFERGVGRTLACGSGACATGYISWKRGFVDDDIVIHQPGGELEISIKNEHIIQRGTANYVFSGEITL